MKIGILGAGNVGGALGKRWALHGHEVCFGVRDVTAPGLVTLVAQSGPNARPGTSQEAAAFGNVVVNALPWPAVEKVLTSLDLSGKVLLDCTNPLKADLSGLDVGTSTSGGEKVAEWARGAQVVKIFNTTGYGNMENPTYHGQGAVMFHCGDNAGAKGVAAQLARDIGFDPADAGPLANARLLEPYAMLWIWLAIRGGFGRDFAFQIVRR
jgi:predicted dinucleotide-binding enzyme